MISFVKLFTTSLEYLLFTHRYTNKNELLSDIRQIKKSVGKVGKKMRQKNEDPRVSRTRRLILDSFIRISERKDFEEITVKNITEEAMINRATFYYHFHDIYDLLDKALQEIASINLNYQEFKDLSLNEEFIEKILLSISIYQKSISARCHSGYEETIARFMRDQLEFIFFNKLSATHDKIEARYKSIMISWSIYGISTECLNSDTNLDNLIKSVTHFTLSSI